MLLHDLERASTYDDFLAVAGTTAALWHAAERRVHLPQDSVFEVSATGRRWRLLVIAEIWCADAMNTVPALRALCASAGNVELRMIARDHAPELMAAHLSTRGTKSMPVVIRIDECDTELAWWGSRPAGLQQRIDIDWATAALEDRYREIRRWYVLDSGTSAVREVVRMIVTAASISQMPAAFAQCSKAFVHRITPSADPLVWKHQLANEPIFELTY